jgi:hypothetical protein
MQHMMGHRVNTKFCVKLQKSPSETLEMLKTLHCETIMSKSDVFKWPKRFREGTEYVIYDERQDTAVTKRTEENVAKSRELVGYDRRLIWSMIVGEPDMSKDILRNVLVQDLGMRTLATKLVPRNLTEEQKDRRLTLCMDFEELIQEDIFFFFWIVSSLVTKHGVISMIPRPNASSWIGDQRIPSGQRSNNECQSLRSK